jgi:hypothetical protein
MFWFGKRHGKQQRKGQRPTGQRASGRRLILENLESRSVLSGASMASLAHFHSAEHEHEHSGATAIHAQVAAHPVTSAMVSKPIQTASSPQVGSTQANVELNATLASTVSGSTASGKASFKSETEHGKTQQSFSVSVQGAAASTKLDVVVNGTNVGQVSTDASGNGRLSFSSRPSGSATAFPANFPTVAATNSITVGNDLSGNFAAGGSSGENEGGEAESGQSGSSGDSGDSGETEGNETKLAATLNDPSGATTATGTASFKSEQEDGSTTTTFKASVTGAAPNASLIVSIDSTPVGTITADANGNGSLYLSSNPKNSNALPLPANFPAVNNGSAVTIGTLTGQLGTATQTASRRGHKG